MAHACARQADRTGATPEDWTHGGFGLYIHWPFCEAKCPYCDFNSHVSRTIDQTRWLNAYRNEITRVAALTGGRVLHSVYFGGGTPSLMNPETVAGILDAIRAAWPRANDLEVTLEANPSSIEAQRFQGYRSAGVNRISVGIQSLRNVDLKRLGRLHDVAQALAALEVARGAFDKVSFDLIYARQDQTADAWRRELSEALALGPQHLSLYQLTIEDGTAFGARHATGRLRGLPDDDAGAEMYEITQELCATAGLEAYEVSNHARPGAESRHNLVYWRYGDYAGIGPGAHGRLTLGGKRHATQTPLAPDEWLAKVEKHGSGAEENTPLAPEDQAAEYLMMSLRLTEGADLKRLARLGNQPLPQERLARLEEMGLVTTAGNRLTCTASGRILLNAVLRELLAG